MAMSPGRPVAGSQVKLAPSDHPMACHSRGMSDYNQVSEVQRKAEAGEFVEYRIRLGFKCHLGNMFSGILRWHSELTF